LQNGSGRFRLTRRAILAGAIGRVALSSAPGWAQKDKPITFGLTPVFLDNDLELLNSLQSYLEEATGSPIELVSRRTYQEITALLVSGQIDAAWICGYPYIQFRDQLVLVALPEWNGKPQYQSYVIVRADRKAESFADLRGDIHAFSDKDSNSGYLVTRALLFDLHTDPERFFRKTMFTYGHRNVIRAVGSGLAQSGSVDGYVWEVMREIESGLVDRTRIVRKSEWLGFPPSLRASNIGASQQL
jgi:phosphate/phosphite/phosphonate ABC transporter binding protein